MTILVTGAAGFIGFHLSSRLLERGEAVIGVDNVNDYYSVALKQARLAQLHRKGDFTFYREDIADREAIAKIFERHANVTGVVHLAAQAGVRYSFQNPYVYVDTNIMGHVVLLEAARRLRNLEHFVYASSSSVYGGNTKQPSSVGDPVDNPVSLYGATKRACELVTESYSQLHALPCTGLRFFSVYGPWGRPDMAAYLFVDAMLAGRPIDVFGHGNMARDFTYIDDIVAGVIATLERPPPANGGKARHRVYNLGNHRSEKLIHFIEILEKLLGRTAEKRMLPLQPGDVVQSFADIDSSRRDLGFEPRTNLAEGLAKFVAWHGEYNGWSKK